MSCEQQNKKQKVSTMSSHDHHHDDGEEHHHINDWEGDSDEDIQCNHEEGGELGCDVSSDPLFQKKEWTLDDWIEFCGRMPPGKSRGKPSPKLIKYAKDLLPSEPARVLVPLCGKTPDLRWLYERGNTVVGIEGVEKLVTEFFQLHNDLTHTVEECSFGKVYKTSDDRLKIYVCDVIKIPLNALGQFDAVFDWGAYSGIHKDERKNYVDVVTSALKDNYRYFVELCHDGPPEGVHGPASISLRELKLHFGPERKVQFLETKDVAKGWGVDSFFTSYILMSSKDD